MAVRESNLKLDFAASSQFSVDDSSYGYEKPDLSIIQKTPHASTSNANLVIPPVPLQNGHLATHHTPPDVFFFFVILYILNLDFKTFFRHK